MVNNIFRNSQKLAIFVCYSESVSIMIKNKFFLILICFFVLAGFLVVTYLDIPAPDKLETKILDVNNETIK